MNIIKRAFLHTTRKKGKSLLLLGLLLGMSTLVLTCYAIRSAANTAALNVRQSLKASFSIDCKATDHQLNEGIMNQILSIDGIKQNYNARSNSYAEYRDTNGTPLSVLTEGAFDVVNGFEHAGKIMSDIYSDKDSMFTEEGFVLTNGRHISVDDKNVVLVHDYLAKQNNLSIGDKIRLALNNEIMEDYEGQTVEAEIIGTFTNEIPQNTTNMLSHIFYENVVFTDPVSYQQLFYETDEIFYEYADFQIDDPAELDTIMDKVKNIDGVDWSVCVFQRYDADYQNAKEALDTLENMVSVMVVIIIVVSLLLLILILALWMRSRVNETGIFLSIGFSKANILLQHICEAMMIAVFAFILSAAVTSFVAQGVGDNLLSRASSSEYEIVRLTEAVTSDDDITLTEIEVKISAKEILAVFMVGSLMVVIAVVFSAVPILKMKPKKILLQMS